MERIWNVGRKNQLVKVGGMAGICIGWEILIELVRLCFSLKAEEYITVSELGR